MDNNNNMNNNPYMNNGQFNGQPNNTNMAAAYEIKHQQELQNKTGLAIASLVLGIISILCCCFGLGWIFGIIGLALGIVSLVQKKGGKGMAIGGIVTGALSLLGTIILVIYVVVIINTIGVHFDEFGNPDAWEKAIDRLMEEQYKETGEYPEEYYKYHMDEEGWFEKYLMNPNGAVKGMDPAGYTYIQ